jgi:hypothetical protein
MRVVVYLAEDGWRWRAESGKAYEDKSEAITDAKKSGPTNAVIITDD